jgi:hypothetical protein
MLLRWNESMSRPALFVVFLLYVPSAFGQGDWFPFTLAWDDSSRTVIDASDLLIDYPGQDPAAVIDARGHLRAGGDGHFYFEKTGRRARSEPDSPCSIRLNRR